MLIFYNMFLFLPVCECKCKYACIGVFNNIINIVNTQKGVYSIAFRKKYSICISIYSYKNNKTKCSPEKKRTTFLEEQKYVLPINGIALLILDTVEKVSLTKRIVTFSRPLMMRKNDLEKLF